MKELSDKRRQRAAKLILAASMLTDMQGMKYYLKFAGQHLESGKNFNETFWKKKIVFLKIW